MFLKEAQVLGLVRAGLGADDASEGVLFFFRPTREVGAEREFSERARGGAVAAPRLDASLLARGHLFEARDDRAEAELSVEPERARLDALLVLEAQLVRLD